MAKNIILHLDKNFFTMLKLDKTKLEEFKGSMTWEEYIMNLFLTKKHLEKKQ